MKICIKILEVMLFTFLLQSCGRSQPIREDFVGIWKANDGAIIELKKDGSYIAKRINYYKIYSDEKLKNERLDFTGNWELANRGNNGKTIILYSSSTFSDYGINRTYTLNGKTYSHKISFNLDISGHGLLQNKPPWYLFVSIGDPDDMNKYKFVK